MNFDEILSAELPPPRDDEPETLRQDILDELSDHLACSTRKELLAGADADSARRLALERFGNPAAIAARLWLDAMKGKIMSQRILVTACLILSVSCLGLIGFTWFQWDRMNKVQAEMMTASIMSQREMLQQVQSITKAVEHSQKQSSAVERGSDWIPLKLRFTSGSADGPPVAEVHAELRRGYSSVGPDRQRKSDSRGVVDFGVVQPGDWKVNLVHSANGVMWRLEHLITISLGGPIEKIIIFPNPPSRLSVKVRVEWPRELAGQGLAAVAKYSYQGTTLQPDLNWMPGILAKHAEIKFFHTFFIHADGRTTNLQSPGRLWTLDSLTPFDASPSRRDDVASHKNGRVFTSLGDVDLGKAAQPAVFLEGRYRLSEFEVLRPSPLLKSSRLGDTFEVLARTSSHLSSIRQLPKIPVDSEELDKMIVTSSQVFTRGLNVHDDLLDRNLQSVVVSADEANEWTIKFPPELIAATLDALKADENAKVKQPAAPEAKPKETSPPKS